jgi:hypothetical protein
MRRFAKIPFHRPVHSVVLSYAAPRTRNIQVFRRARKFLQCRHAKVTCNVYKHPAFLAGRKPLPFHHASDTGYSPVIRADRGGRIAFVVVGTSFAVDEGP